MELVLRAVNDRFLESVALPFLSLASRDVRGALERLADAVEDDTSRFLAEFLLEQRPSGNFTSVEGTRWVELTQRLLFMEWEGDGFEGGWRPSPQREAWASGLDEALHLALLLEDADYPYAEPLEAREVREVYRTLPPRGMGLATFLAGGWEPTPDFAPHELFMASGRGRLLPEHPYAFADWSVRGASKVRAWSEFLPRRLDGLLDREASRVSPVELSERESLVAYCLGAERTPPSLTVAFSGLGAEAMGWVTSLGSLMSFVRRAARGGKALVATLVTPARGHRGEG